MKKIYTGQDIMWRQRIMVQKNASTPWRQREKEINYISRTRTYYTYKTWPNVRTERCHSHKLENDDVCLNLCSGYQENA